MNIVNIIHMGDQVKNFDDLSDEEKRYVATKLNEQALRSIGYRKRQEDETA